MTTSRDRSTRAAGAGYLSFLREHPRFLGFGFALTLFSSFGQTYFLSTFGEPIRAAFDLTAGGWGLRIRHRDSRICLHLDVDRAAGSTSGI